MPWTLGDVTAESVSSTSVDSTAVSANSITIQGSPVYAKRTIVITGMFNNIFSQTGGQDFLELDVQHGSHKHHPDAVATL